MATNRFAITVYGRVQGVGFRYHVSSCALKRHLTGWVCNCSDGSVAMEVQGQGADLELFKQAVREGSLLARVRDMTVVELPVMQDEKGFVVRH